MLPNCWIQLNFKNLTESLMLSNKKVLQITKNGRSYINIDKASFRSMQCCQIDKFSRNVDQFFLQLSNNSVACLMNFTTFSPRLITFSQLSNKFVLPKRKKKSEDFPIRSEIWLVPNISVLPKRNFKVWLEFPNCQSKQCCQIEEFL